MERKREIERKKERRDWGSDQKSSVVGGVSRAQGQCTKAQSELYTHVAQHRKDQTKERYKRERQQRRRKEKVTPNEMEEPTSSCWSCHVNVRLLTRCDFCFNAFFTCLLLCLASYSSTAGTLAPRVTTCLRRSPFSISPRFALQL